jgi:hypothetical protein
MGIQADAISTPSYLIQSGGLDDPADGVYAVPSDGSPPSPLTSSTYTCLDCFPAMEVTDVAPSAASNQVVPEPGFGAALATGLVGLLVLGKRKKRGERGWGHKTLPRLTLDLAMSPGPGNPGCHGCPPYERMSSKGRPQLNLPSKTFPSYCLTA